MRRFTAAVGALPILASLLRAVASSWRNDRLIGNCRAATEALSGKNWVDQHNRLKGINQPRKDVLGSLVVTLSLALMVGGSSCSDDNTVEPLPNQPSADMYVSWSPDGNRLAVSWSRATEDRALGIYLIDLDTWSTSGPIVSRPGKFGSIRWSPDSEWLLLSMGRQLHKVKTNGDSLTQLTSGDNHYFGDWAPSDTMIAAGRHPGDSSGIWLIDVDGSDPRYLVWAGGHPCFDPFDSLLFHSWKRVSDPDTAHIALLWPADSGVRTVCDYVPGAPYHTYRYLCVSPVDRRIVLQIDLNIFTLTIDGTELTQLTMDGGHCPTWSPDGSRIAYVKPTLEGGSLWIMNSDGSNKTPVPCWE